MTTKYEPNIPVQAKLIRMYRITARMSQQDLARDMGMDKHSIYQYERGMRLPSNINLRAARDCCNARMMVMFSATLPDDHVLVDAYDELAKVPVVGNGNKAAGVTVTGVRK